MSEAERFLKERIGQKHANQQRRTRPTNDRKADSLRTPSPFENRQHTQREEEIPAGPQRIASFDEAWMGFWTHWTLNGRASRAEYWWMTIFFTLPDTLILISHDYENPGHFINPLIEIAVFLYVFATCIPSICLTVRRLHDANFSGGWWFLRFLPIIGWITLFIMLLYPSDPRSNRYGPVPYTQPRGH